MQEQTRKLESDNTISNISQNEIENLEKRLIMLKALYNHQKNSARKEEIDKNKLETFFHWCLTGNNFLNSTTKNDKKTNELSRNIAISVGKRLGGSAVGMAFISTGGLAWLGVIIILYSNTPNVVLDALKEELGETFLKDKDFLKKIENPDEFIIKKFDNIIKNIKESTKNKEEILKNANKNLVQVAKKTKEEIESTKKEITDKKSKYSTRYKKASGKRSMGA